MHGQLHQQQRGRESTGDHLPNIKACRNRILIKLQADSFVELALTVRQCFINGTLCASRTQHRPLNAIARHENSAPVKLAQAVHHCMHYLSQRGITVPAVKLRRGGAVPVLFSKKR